MAALAGNVHVVTVKPGFVRTRVTAGMKLPSMLTAEPEKGRPCDLSRGREQAARCYLRGFAPAASHDDDPRNPGANLQAPASLIGRTWLAPVLIIGGSRFRQEQP